MDNWKRFLVFLIFLFFIVSLYIALYGWVGIELNTAIEKASTASTGNGPVIYRDVSFKNKEALTIYKRYEIAEKIFPSLYNVPKPILFVFTVMAFGYIGGLIRVLYDITSGKKNLSNTTLCSLALSSLNGVLILGVSYVIPSILTVSDVTLRPLALLFLCLFAGFSEETVPWILEKLKNIFQ